MKKLLIVFAIAFAFASCSESEVKTNETNLDSIAKSKADTLTKSVTDKVDSETKKLEEESQKLSNEVDSVLEDI